MKDRAKLLKNEERLSLGIKEIIHDSDCGTSRYSSLPCFEDNGTGGTQLARVPCKLVRVRKWLLETEAGAK